MNLDVMISYLPLYKDALFLTMRVGWKGVVIAVLIGLIGSAILHFEIPIAKTVVSAYTQLFRNTPLLGLLGGAYMTETFRSGLESIPKIQFESAESLGMSRGQVFRYVILPQAISSSIPGLMANVIFLLKETSVFSTISLMDLMFTAKDLIGMYAKTIECLTLLVVFYLIMLLPVSILGNILERRLRYAEFGD